MTQYSIGPEQENMLKDMDSYQLRENIKNSYWIHD